MVGSREMYIDVAGTEHDVEWVFHRARVGQRSPGYSRHQISISLKICRSDILTALGVTVLSDKIPSATDGAQEPRH